MAASGMPRAYEPMMAHLTMAGSGEVSGEQSDRVTE
ncbi:Uncharacterised protein [Edwardsiella tarda]|nr:Uncharacterised protein [Edwardsiella tarda]